MKGKPAEPKKVAGMTVTGKTTRAPRKKKKPKNLADHTRGLKAAIKW